MSTESSINAADRPRLRERLLGAFILFQLTYIPLASYIKLVPVRIEVNHDELNGDLQLPLRTDAQVFEPVQKVKDAVAFAVSRWNEVSGQHQIWALFVTFGEQASLPAVEIHWPAAAQRKPVELKCYFEPADPSHYFHPPEPCCRLFNYEYRTVIYYAVANLAKDAAEPDRYRKEAMESVRDQRKSTTAYLRWKLSQFQKLEPDAPAPEFVVLKARVFPDPPAGASRLARPAMFEVPVARWRPDEPAQLDAWDPLLKRFQRISAESEP